MTDQHEVAIQTAAKARWEAAHAHYEQEGREHPTWDEVGTGRWWPYPKELLFAWEVVARDAYEDALRLAQQEGALDGAAADTREASC